jgi:S-adenosylmethionine:tRNA ribosyltransferase-isomerase
MSGTPLVPLATDLFDYPLPPHLVAQAPAARRDQSRLLVVHRATRQIEHTVFAELPRFLQAGDTLFRNTAAVLPARLHAVRPTGGQVECFLLGPVAGGADQVWRCLMKPGKKLPVGAAFADPGGGWSGEVVAKETDGSAQVRFTTPGGEPITAVANRLGDVPLPPYIERPPAGRSLPAGDENQPPAGTKPSPASRLLPTEQRVDDRERYQTVYADRARQVAVAAPTAGLHFTPELLAALTAHGVTMADLTLHVGLGTFKPITTDTIQAHAIHREIYELPAATQAALRVPRTGHRIAVGTTTVRSVEDFLAGRWSDLTSRRSSDPNQRAGVNALHPGQTHVAEAGIFIYPPYQFRGVDALITNFHQPRSTLLCLVAAFLAPGSTEGIAWLREIYAEAVAREYRFFSYGDAMLIL